MCQKSGKTLIPVYKPQVYFVDVVKCVNEICSQEMTHLALPTAWNARRRSEPAQLNSVRNLISPTDRPTNRPYPGPPGPTIAGGRHAQCIRVLHREAD